MVTVPAAPESGVDQADVPDVNVAMPPLTVPVTPSGYVLGVPIE